SRSSCPPDPLSTTAAARHRCRARRISIRSSSSSGGPTAGFWRSGPGTDQEGRKTRLREAFLSHAQAHMRLHSSSLLAVLALCSFPTRSNAEKPPDSALANVPRVRSAALPRGAEALLLIENGGNPAPLLRPEAFRRLSSAGQRAVLRAAGLLVPPANARQPRAPEARPTRPLTPSVGQNVRVNDPTTDVLGHTQSESSIAARGGNVIVGFQDANEENVSAFGLSTDGGSTFQQQSLPEIGENLGDPVVAFGPNGEIYYTSIANDGVSVITLCASKDNATTWTCGEASGGAANVYDLQDKSWMAVDTSNSKYRGTVYVVWTDVSQVYDGGGSFTFFTYTRDGGQTYSIPVTLSPLDGSAVARDPTVSVGPAGEVWVSYFDDHFGGSGITVTKSVDGGNTF